MSTIPAPCWKWAMASRGVHGLANAMASEMIEFPNDIFGIAFNLEEDNVGCVLFGEDQLIHEGDTAKRTGRLAEVPVGEGTSWTDR